MTNRAEPKYGQVLVVVAIALFVLFAFVALAIDVGGVYQERRAMQNAADAGALAGAREMCYVSEANAEAVAREYAVTRNGAAGALITVTAPTSVTVVATQSFETYFAQLLGFEEIAVSADATAVCGRSEATGDLWPVGFNGQRWKESLDSGDIVCGDRIIIWQGASEIECGTEDDLEDKIDCCHLYAKKNDSVPSWSLCDADEDVPNIYPLDRAGWIDFTAGLTRDDPCDPGSAGIGANELTYRIRGYDQKGEECTPWVSVPDCYAGGVGNEGEAMSAWGTAEDQRDRIVTIPLYDPCFSTLQTGAEPPDCDGAQAPDDISLDDDGVCEITDSNSGGNERFLITGLACLKIGLYRETVEEDFNPDHETWTWETTVGYLKYHSGASYKDPVIVATVPCDEDGNSPAECFSNPGYTLGDPAGPGELRAVSLVD